MNELLPKLKYDVVVIGGGPAGCFAAIEAARGGLSVAIVEKNKSIGRKLMITGKGRCNITNACDTSELVKNIPENGRFMYSALSEYSNLDIIDEFNRLGVKTKIERGNRVFPVSDDAKEVKEAILKELKRLKVKIYYETQVLDVEKNDEDEFVSYLSENEMKLYSKALVVATGGKSYPLTGSTGDGYRFATKLGHTVSDLYPGLVGLKTREGFVKELNGLTLKNVGVKLFSGNRLVYSDFGELLFTLHGVSGPVILSSSFDIYKYDFRGIDLSIDLKPALDEKQLTDRVKRDFQQFNKKNYSNSLDLLLPKSLIPVFIRQSGIKSDKIVAEISSDEISKIVKLLKDFRLEITGYTSFDEAIVTIGGVSCKEVNPKTMESKICPNLYIVGEVLNVTGYTGGFNLTVAFSTGHLAGINIKNTFSEEF